ncbi:MAG: hypothetical protein ABEJ43_06485 [Haloferacaceae archaeon]
MLRSVLARLRAWLAGDEADGSRVVRSRLDASVREAHGGGEAEVERELSEVRERAETLEEGRRDGTE